MTAKEIQKIQVLANKFKAIQEDICQDRKLLEKYLIEFDASECGEGFDLPEETLAVHVEDMLTAIGEHAHLYR
jgi:hypothetical protein